MPSDPSKPRKRAPPPPPKPPSWLRRHWALAAGVAAVALGAALWNAPADAGAGNPLPAPAPAARAGTEFFSDVGAAPELPQPSDRAERRQLLVERYQLADHTLCSYQEGSQYPAESRPIGEHPDQVYPNLPVTESHQLHTGSGRSDPTVQVQTSQSRVFMASGEAVAFSLRALDLQGNVLPLVVSSAIAHGITYQARPTQQVALAFADDGKGPDPVPGDGAFAALLDPARSGLAGFNGTIRTEVRFSAGGRAGVVLFDVIYTPELPATWSGQVREALEGGSLNYYLKADVRVAGRYIVTGRVDDAGGKPFALATFNELLNTGPNEVRLTVFGKLLRDEQPAMPLTLRDVDGYLLKENTDPDRALMPRLEGKVYVGKAQALSGISDAEWQGAERARYLAEFGKDLALAKAALAEFDPAQPPPASACPKR